VPSFREGNNPRSYERFNCGGRGWLMSTQSSKPKRQSTISKSESPQKEQFLEVTNKPATKSLSYYQTRFLTQNEISKETGAPRGGERGGIARSGSCSLAGLSTVPGCSLFEFWNEFRYWEAVLSLFEFWNEFRYWEAVLSLFEFWNEFRYWEAVLSLFEFWNEFRCWEAVYPFLDFGTNFDIGKYLNPFLNFGTHFDIGKQFYPPLLVPFGGVTRSFAGDTTLPIQQLTFDHHIY
jgi:hypothetical protein